ncbi:MAG: hypothetical protein WDO70_02330 [Alphaproteobacteria bacterium]
MIDEVTKRLDVTNDGRSFAIKVVFSGNSPQMPPPSPTLLPMPISSISSKPNSRPPSAPTNGCPSAWPACATRFRRPRTRSPISRRQNNLTEISGGTITTQQASQINSQLVEARAIRAQAEARLRGVQDMVRTPRGANASGDVLASQLIQRLREQESEVRRKLAEMTNRYGERHPQIINQKEELRDIQSRIAEEVGKIVQGLANESRYRPRQGSQPRGRAEADSGAGRGRQPRGSHAAPVDARSRRQQGAV